jgi:hypothetical protein
VPDGNIDRMCVVLAWSLNYGTCMHGCIFLGSATLRLTVLSLMIIVISTLFLGNMNLLRSCIGVRCRIFFW